MAQGTQLPDVARVGRGFILRGALTVAFGVVVWVWPNATARTIGVLLGIALVAAGAGGLLARLGGRSDRGGSTGSVLLVLIGLAVLFWPHASGAVVMALIGVAAIVMGFLMLLTGLALRRVAPAFGWSVVVIGVLALAFGIVATVHPGQGAAAVVWLVGLLAVVIGAGQVVLGAWLRRNADRFALARTDVTVVNTTLAGEQPPAPGAAAAPGGSAGPPGARSGPPPALPPG